MQHSSGDPVARHDLAWKLAWKLRNDEDHAAGVHDLATTANELVGDNTDEALALLATYAWHLREAAADALDLDDYDPLDQRVAEKAAHSYMVQPSPGPRPG